VIVMAQKGILVLIDLGDLGLNNALACAQK
jgi:hypothetical protein